MGSDESHFNVSLIVRNKVARRCPQTTTFLKRKESRSVIKPRSFRLPAYRLTARPNRLSAAHCAYLHFFYIFFIDRQPTRATYSPRRKGTLAPSLRSGVPSKVLVHRARLCGRRTGDRGYQGRCVDADSWRVCVDGILVMRCPRSPTSGPRCSLPVPGANSHHWRDGAGSGSPELWLEVVVVVLRSAHRLTSLQTAVHPLLLSSLLRTHSVLGDMSATAVELVYT